ncbi:GyrI-like domain-containing protein [Brevibacillus fulvus]|uniref:AraC family transcriptional regulator n=1 Tax=Brevibacillus fulvus TaxID=1125967 RepID=A0A938XZY6_9BACL|nr:GyrI-like domain-containing protein [Brevibacillus fulvus]MBM7591354.1 AraC family transcriptional regulator [Brevibacillus fulvus]
MEITIGKQPEFHLVGLFYAGPFSALSQGVPNMVKTLQSRLAQIPHKRDPLTRYEVSFEDPNGIYTILACTEVEQFQIPPGMIGYTVPALTYAHAVHHGPLVEVPNTYISVFRWLAEHGYTRRTDLHSIERYHADTENNRVEILIPLEA